MYPPNRGVTQCYKFKQNITHFPILIMVSNTYLTNSSIVYLLNNTTLFLSHGCSKEKCR